MTHQAVCVGCDVKAIVEIQEGEVIRIFCNQCGVEQDGDGFRETVRSSMVPVLAGLGQVGKPAGPFRFTVCG